MKKAKVKKIVLTVLEIVLGIIIIAVIAISIMASKNMKAMNKALDGAMNKISENYKVTEVDAGEYGDMTIYGVLKFHVKQYEVEEIGNLSIMKVNMGFMQMGTMILTPLDKNLPLFSLDYMYTFASRKGYIEFYNLVDKKDLQYDKLINDLKAVKNEYDNFENVTPSEAWYQDLVGVGTYKKWSSKEDSRGDKMITDNLNTYFKASKNLKVLTKEEQSAKIEVTKKYTDGLIENGGISTDVFKKSLGEEVTRDFFDKVLFGSGRR